MPPQESPRERLARLMDDRRAALDMTWSEVADEAGITREGLRKLRFGSGAIRSQSRAGIERALGWEQGSVASVLSGGEPTEAEPRQLTAEELLDDMEKTLNRVEKVIAARASDERELRLGMSSLEVLRAIVEQSTSQAPDS